VCEDDVIKLLCAQSLWILALDALSDSNGFTESVRDEHVPLLFRTYSDGISGLVYGEEAEEEEMDVPSTVGALSRVVKGTAEYHPRCSRNVA
jgi:hypothetical protein